MKDNTDKKTSGASKVSMSQIVDKIKSENAERFDQMLIDSEIVRNDIFYINFKASYVNLIPKKVAFAMLPKVKNYFENNCCGSSSLHEEVCEVDKKFIKSITSSDCNIAKKEYSGSYQPSNFKSNNPYQFLRQGLLRWKDTNAKNESLPTEKKGSLLGNIKNAAGSISSAVNSVGDKINSVDDKINELGEKLDNSFKWLDDGKGKSESEKYSSLKSNYFSHLKFDYNGAKISKTQPTYFIPELTHSETCKDCRGDGETECSTCKGDGETKCPTCKGKGRLKCKGYVGSGSGGPASNAVYSCKNGRAKCDSCDGSGYKNGKRCYKRCDDGRITCPTCKGDGDVNCELKYASSYGIGKISDLATGKDFCKGTRKIKCKPCKATGKIKCEPCKATGEIGKIVY